MSNNFNSSFLKVANYNEVTNEMVVQFRNGAIYAYNVVPAVWQELISAESAGTYFNNFIKPYATRLA